MVQMIGSAITPVNYNPVPQGYGNMAMPGYGPAAGSPAGGSSSLLGGALAMLGIGGAAMGGGGGMPAGMDAAAVQNIQSGAAQGNTIGNLRMGISAASLANSGALKYGVGGSTQLGYGLGTAGGILGLYSGLKQGGVVGDVGAVGGALQAGSGIAGLAGNTALAGTLGTAAGVVGGGLSTYEAIKNWQSGNTGSDALAGAEAGASWGAFFGPIGMGVGAVIGGAVGALSSAFGGGKSSQEAGMAQGIDTQLSSATASQRANALSGMSAAQSVQMVNGYMNAHDNSPGHSEPIEQVFGKNGVANMFQAMMPAINAAVKKDPALGKLNASQMYSQVVAPWLKSKGATVSASTKDKNGNPEGQNLIDAITNVIGDWQSGKITSKTALGVSGQSINIPAYGG